MVKLWNWLAGIAVMATTVYVLSNYSFRKVPNGFEINSSKSKTTITSDSNARKIESTYAGRSGNIETVLNHDINGFSGSFKSPNDFHASANYNNTNKQGAIETKINNKFIGKLDIRYDAATKFQNWIWGFEYLFNNSGLMQGYKVSRI